MLTLPFKITAHKYVIIAFLEKLLGVVRTRSLAN